MVGLESGEAAVRETSAMDPLWEECVVAPCVSTLGSIDSTYFYRYIFPPEPDDTGMLDLTGDDVSFYLNPYSGDLSLEFPKVNRSCRGGILACVRPVNSLLSLTYVYVIQRWCVFTISLKC